MRYKIDLARELLITCRATESCYILEEDKVCPKKKECYEICGNLTPEIYLRELDENEIN